MRHRLVEQNQFAQDELSSEESVSLTMTIEPLFLDTITHFLWNEFHTDRYPETEQGGIYHATSRPIQRIGLALEPFPGVSAWVQETQIDALWLHRPWKLDLADFPADVGIFFNHLSFDETLTIGYNTYLASRLGAMGTPEPLGYKQVTNEAGVLLPQRPIGMLTDVAEHEFDYWLAMVKQEFGGYDRAETGRDSTGWQVENCRVAVVGAMTDELVREAANRGANLYLTGAYRKPAQQAVDETGIAVVAVGHRRSEEWGMQALADILQKRWPVDCFIHE